MKNRPPKNPFLFADSVFPMIHCDSTQSDSTDEPLWLGTHHVSDSDLHFEPLSWASHGIVHKRPC